MLRPQTSSDKALPHTINLCGSLLVVIDVQQARCPQRARIQHVGVSLAQYFGPERQKRLELGQGTSRVGSVPPALRDEIAGRQYAEMPRAQDLGFKQQEFLKLGKSAGRVAGVLPALRDEMAGIESFWCKCRMKNPQKLECAPAPGQFQAASLTG